jgi:hypothetical protein
LASRAVGNKVYLVSTSYFDLYWLTPYLDPWNLEHTYPGSSLNRTTYKANTEEELEHQLGPFVAQTLRIFDCATSQKLSLFQTRATQWRPSWFSWSDETYDAKAFRYLPNEQLRILPVVRETSELVPCEDLFTDDTLFNTGNTTTDDFFSDMLNSTTTDNFVFEECSNYMSTFDGFRVFYVNATSGNITEYFSFAHALFDSTSSGCYYEYLPSLTVVINGNILSFKGHTIQSHDLDTKEENADPIDLDTGLDSENCSDYYFP